MIISLIVAFDNKHGIGLRNTIPWMGKIPRDMKHFRDITTDHTVIMGKNTFLSMGSKPLPNRRNVVVSRTLSRDQAGVEIYPSLNDAIDACKVQHNDEIFILGGAKVYQEALPLADRMYLTVIDGVFETDVFFPEFSLDEWSTENDEKFVADEKNKYALRFLTLKRTTT